MSSNEEYLDGLLKSVTTDETKKKNSFSTDDLSKMLDQLEELEASPSKKEQSTDHVESTDETDNLKTENSEIEDSEIEDAKVKNNDIEDIDTEDNETEDNETEDNETEDNETEDTNIDNAEQSTDDISLDDLLANVELNNQELFSADKFMETAEPFHEMDSLLSDLTSSNSEISELLGQSTTLEDEAQDPKNKKKQKKVKKSKKKNEKVDSIEQNDDSVSNEIDLLFQDTGESEEIQLEDKGTSKGKEGLFHKLGELLFSGDEEDEDEVISEKKAKPEKKKKGNKKGEASETPAGDGTGEDETDSQEGSGNKGSKKGNKNKKEKAPKVKKEKKEKVPQKSDGIKIPKARFIKTFLICFSIFAVIMVISVFVPKKIEIMMAQDAYFNQDYEKAFELLDGKKLNSSDQIIYTRTFIILQLQRKIDSYHNYIAMKKPLEALDALMQGIVKYDELQEDAKLYNVTPKIEELYLSILVILSDNYQLTEADAREIVLYEYDWVYSKRLESIVYGTEFINPYEQATQMPADEANTTEPVLEDLLPEEMDMTEE